MRWMILMGLALASCEYPEITIETHDTKFKLEYDLFDAGDSSHIESGTLYDVKGLMKSYYLDSLEGYHQDTVYGEAEMIVY
jgi:hypothetical protein